MTSTQTPQPPQAPPTGPGLAGGSPHGSGPDAPRPTTSVEPARRLSPAPEDDRPWRLLITLLGAAFVALMVLGLAAMSITQWTIARGYDDVPATTHLGEPSSLSLSSRIADVRVLRSADADQVSVALVENGATELPPADSLVRARIDQQGPADAPVLDVRQPEQFSSVPWKHDVRDVLVIVPEAHRLAVDIISSVGDIRADGDYSAMTISSQVGEVRLSPVSAPGGLDVSSDVGGIDIELEGTAPETIGLSSSVGDIDLRLPSGAESDVDVHTDVGSADVAAPGTGRWAVDARADTGDARVDPSLTRADGPLVGTLTVVSDLGDVTVTR
ncbi:MULTISPECIES: hypothetical protein [unclassified Brachybacterium]|uniref:hypothetical protein n=1 Tax=unclassified Brachybacterium TaxID=2623841 RepID=UPI00361EFEE2